MVKELEITHWDPFEIAEMIQGEISSLLPHYDTFNYQEYDNEGDDDGSHHPFYDFSSASSSQASISGLNTSHGNDKVANLGDWVQGMISHHYTFTN